MSYIFILLSGTSLQSVRHGQTDIAFGRLRRENTMTNWARGLALLVAVVTVNVAFAVGHRLNIVIILTDKRRHVKDVLPLSEHLE